MSSEFLKSLGLSNEELAALNGQGFVASEVRGNRTLFKLRFRLDKQQRVKSLGTDPVVASRVADELNRLQAERRQQIELKRLVREVGTWLRASKRAKEAVAASVGMTFHGYALRRRRVKAA